MGAGRAAGRRGRRGWCSPSPPTRSRRARIGDQTGGRVFLFLHTDDFWRDHAAMKAKGVRFLEVPRHEAYGWVAVFEDNWGNRWDLLQLADKAG